MTKQLNDRRFRIVRAAALSLSGLLFSISLVAAATLQQQQSAEPPFNTNVPTASNQTTILVTTVAGILSLLVTQVFGMWRENQRERFRREEAERQQAAADKLRAEDREAAERQRKWDLEDRQRAREEMRHHAERQLVETFQTAIDIAKVSNMNKAQLLEHLEHNTNLTKEAKAAAETAYIAANNFNEKLEHMRRQITAKGGQIDHVEQVSVDTNQKVTDLQTEIATAEEKRTEEKRK